MTETEYLALTKQKLANPLISIDSLLNKTPRTLIYGFDLDRNTHHVYLDEAVGIVSVVYSHNKLVLSSATGVLNPSRCIPVKRAYPAASDYEFCNLLIEHNLKICFTTFDDRKPKPFHGLRLPELLTGLNAEELNYSAKLWEDPIGFHLAEYNNVSSQKLSLFLQMLVNAVVFDRQILQEQDLLTKRTSELVTELFDLQDQFGMFLAKDELAALVQNEVSKAMEFAGPLKLKIRAAA